MFNLEDQIRLDKRLREDLRSASQIILNYRFEYREERGTVQFIELNTLGEKKSIQLTSDKEQGMLSIIAAKSLLEQQAQELRKLIGDTSIISGYYLKGEKAEFHMGSLRTH